MTITDKEFADKVIGKPWKRFGTGSQSYDCWGLVIASFREIDGVELPELTGYLSPDLSYHDIAKNGLGEYRLASGEDGDIVCMYNVNNEFVHVGRMFFGMVLHAFGTQDNPGQVKLDRLDVVRRLFNKVEFRRYASSGTI